MRLEDLPARARDQAVRQLAGLGSKGSGKRHKYNNTRVVRGKLSFDSKREAARYDVLCAMLGEGRIRDLKLQPEYTLQEGYTTPSGEKIRPIRYRADFSYDEYDSDRCVWVPVVEDVKGVKTDVYKLKRKLMADRFGVAVREV